MLNFANLFNQFRSQANNGISDLLDQANVKMGRLLDEDTFMNEYKSSNPRVIEFMKYKRFQELIEFVTVVGPADDKKRSYKYPLSTCDLLSVDNNTAIEYFFPERPLAVDEKVVEEIEVQVETEVEQSLETPKEDVPDSPPKTEQSTVQPEKAQQNQPSKTPDEQNSAQAERPSQTEIELLIQSIEKDKPLEEKAEPLTVQKKMKKVITLQKRKVQKIIKRQVEPLISKLMVYFDQTVNYTLAGYVSKIVSVFFTKRPAIVMKYMLEEDVVEKLLNHAESRSVGELMIKMLTNETTLCLDKRRDFFKAILRRMSVSSEIYIMSNISAYVCEIIQKIATNLKGNNKIIEFNNVFFSLDVIQQVIRNVMSDDQNTSVYNAPILFTYLTNVPFILPEDESIVDQFKKLLEHFIEKSCEKLEVKSENRPKLGTGRVKIIQILRFILKENVLNSKQMIGNKEGFFGIVINLMKQYQMNNMLHNELMKIIEIALSEKEGSTLNNAIVRDNILITLISEEANQDKKIKAGTSVYQHRKGYIAHIINLAIKLKELSENNQNIKMAIESPQFTNAYEAFIEKEIFKNRKSLAGFSLRKDLKHEIMFQREDIIAAYANFLQKCPSPVFQKNTIEEPINIEHPDLVEQLEKQLKQNLTVKNNEEKIQEKSDQKDIEAEISTAPDHLSDQPSLLAEVATLANYWSPYLEYNIDELIIDL